MEAYFTLDKDPHGGIYDVFHKMPDMEHLRNTVQEIRHGDLPEEVFNGIYMAELKPDPVDHFDQYYLPHYKQATTVWTREGGFVNDNK